MNDGSEHRSAREQVGTNAADPSGRILLVGVEPQVWLYEHFQVLQSGRIGEAAEILADTEVEAVVVSLDLPDSSGLSTLQRMRRSTGAPIVVVVGDEAECRENGLRALEQGASAYLVRNACDPATFEPAVRSAMAGAKVSAADADQSERLRIAAQGTGDGLWDWNLGDGSMYYSAPCAAVLGIGHDETRGPPGLWFDRVHPEDAAFLDARLKAHLEGSSSTFRCEHRILDGFGEPRWVVARGMAVRDLDGTASRFAGFLTDVTTRRRSEDDAVRRSLHDGLTGLPNRGLFMDRISHRLGALKRQDGSHFAVLFLDLDHFKFVNDVHGHAAGDEVLRAVSKTLEMVLRPGDSVARLGGDEFGILISDINEVAAAVHVADRVLDLLSQPVSIGRNEIVVGASIGIAMTTTGYQDGASMLHDADLAMYRAKSMGRARYQVCDPTMHEIAVARLRLETELQDALVQGQFVMHYQPLIDLKTGTIAGLEAMVRWKHPTCGILTPTDFIEVAKSSGLIVPLGWWVLGESCRYLRHLRRLLPPAEKLWMCVNVAAKVIMRDDMVEQVSAILRRNDLPENALILEFDEGVALQHGESTLARLEELREKKIRLCIDDFGTGYSSVSHLDQCHYDLLKIDTSVVHRLDDGEGKDQLLPTLLDLARDMGIQTAAEGVEAATQVRALRRLGCDLAQGYWFARPMSPEDIERALIEPPPWWIPGREESAVPT